MAISAQASMQVLIQPALLYCLLNWVNRDNGAMLLPEAGMFLNPEWKRKCNETK